MVDLTMKLLTLLRISGYLAFFDDFGNIDDNYQYYAANSNYNYGGYNGDYSDSDATYQYDPSVYDQSSDMSTTEKTTRNSDQESRSKLPVIVVDELNHDRPKKGYKEKDLSLEKLFQTAYDDYEDKPKEHPSRQRTNDLYVGTDDTQKRPVLLWTKKTSNLNLLAAETDPDELLERMQQNVNIDVHFGSMLNLLNYLISLEPVEIRRKKRDDGSGTLWLSAEDITDYGCWCSRIPNLLRRNTTSFSESIGGKPLDAIDQVCRDWFKCQKCVTISHESSEETDYCSGLAGHTGFVVGVVMDESTQKYDLTCDDPANFVRPCARDACTCGAHFVREIVKHLSVWNPNFSRHNPMKLRDGQNLQYCVKPSGIQHALSYENTEFRSEQYSEFGNTEKEEKIVKCCGKAPLWQPYVEQRHQCCERNDGGYKLKNLLGSCDERL